MGDIGGYSGSIVVREDFVLRIPEGMKPEVAAPIHGAGIVTHSPMKHWGVGPGKKVMKAAAKLLDFILSTIPHSHDANPT